jgi:hypothetical protein
LVIFAFIFRPEMIGLNRIGSDNRQLGKLQLISFNREFAHCEKRGALHPSERSAVWPTDSCRQSYNSRKAWFIDLQTHFLGLEVAVPLSVPKVYLLRLPDWVCEAAVPVKALLDAQREQPAVEQALTFFNGFCHLFRHFGLRYGPAVPTAGRGIENGR